MSILLRRREFIAGLGGAAVCPLAARGQQGDRVRRIGVLMGQDENDPVAKSYFSAFAQALAGLGWTDGRNGPEAPGLNALETYLSGNFTGRDSFVDSFRSYDPHPSPHRLCRRRAPAGRLRSPL
jgi:hypothetical protein